MPMDKFLIAPFNTGLQTNLRPFLIMDDAFESIENAYVFRGRVRKRFGSLLMGATQLNSRLRVDLSSGGAGVGITTALGAATGNVLIITGLATLPLAIGQIFSIGSVIFTVSVLGTPGLMLNNNTPTNLGNTDSSGNAAGIVPGAVGVIGQVFMIGTQKFTVVVANGALSTTGSGSGTFNIATGAYTFTGAAASTAIFWNPAVGTFNTTTGAFVFSNAPALTAIYFYPSLPVVGITQYESGAVNNHPSYAFDPSFAYLFTGGSWARSGAALWHGAADGTNFMWTCNWQGSVSSANTGVPVMFATNFNFTLGAGKPGVSDDPIWYTADGSVWVAMLGSSVNGIFFLPAGGARVTSPFVQTARIIVPFKNRLVLLNTVENNNSGGAGSGTATQYKNRCRYSFNGSPLALNAWYEPNQVDAAGAVAAGAGFIDAATEEQIISAEFIKDRLIVYFERSTWELAYTGNEILPFIWNKLNTELGSQSTFSTVPFDKEILTIGNTGIHSCNGSNVSRIDEKIPDEIFEFKASANGNLRTAGIRDYFAECVYWTFVSDLSEPTQTFPNQILVYNYKNGSWALNDDCFTAFGYFEQQTDLTWASSAPSTWLQNNQTWSSGLTQANQRVIIAGDQEGFVVKLATDDNPSPNAPAMQLTNIIFNGNGTLDLVIINHNFSQAGAGLSFPDYLIINSIVGDATLMATLNGQIFPVDKVVDANTVRINTNLLLNLYDPVITPPILAGTYNGGGTIARVSNIQIRSKRYNPYDKEDFNVYLAKIDFAVQRTANGQITVDYYPSAAEGVSMLDDGVASGSIMGNNILETSPYSQTYYPLEQFQEMLWHPVYFQSSGECIQLIIYMSQRQMMISKIALSDFELEGMILYTQKVGRMG